MNISTIVIRLMLTVILLLFVYEETGLATAGALGLVCISIEIITYQITTMIATNKRKR